MKSIIKNIITKELKKRNYELLKHDIVPDQLVYSELFSSDSIKKRQFYNISAGGHFGFGGRFFHPYWTNIDVDIDCCGAKPFDPKIDISHDLLSLNSIPVETESAELVHSRVTIEHITDEAAQFMFREVFRMLKTGGVFRIVCPDINLDVRALLNNDRHFYYWSSRFPNLRNESLEHLFLDHFAGSLATNLEKRIQCGLQDNQIRALFTSGNEKEALNFITSKIDLEVQKKNRQFHMNWWNHEKLSQALQNAGFKSVFRSGAGQSYSPAMRNPIYFDNFSNRVMLFADAVKE